MPPTPRSARASEPGAQLFALPGTAPGRLCPTPHPQVKLTGLSVNRRPSSVQTLTSRVEKDRSSSGHAAIRLHTARRTGWSERPSTISPARSLVCQSRRSRVAQASRFASRCVAGLVDRDACPSRRNGWLLRCSEAHATARCRGRRGLTDVSDGQARGLAGQLRIISWDVNLVEQPG
jgi:hypothetical protein